MLIDPKLRITSGGESRPPQPPGGGGPPGPPRDTRARQPEQRRGIPALIDALLRASSFDDLIELIPMRVAQYLHCRRVVLYIARDEMLDLVGSTIEATQGFSSTLVRIMPVQIALNDAAPEAIALTGMHALIDSGADTSPSRIIAPLHGLHGKVGVLVLLPSADETAWGADGLRASPLHVGGLEDIARVIGVILEDALLHRENRQRAEKMDLLNRLTNTFNSSVLDLDLAINIVERQASRITHVDMCSVALGTANGRSTSMSGGWLRAEIVKFVQSSRAQITLNEIYNWPLAHMLPPQVRSFYAYPLVADDRVVGVLALGFVKPHFLEPSENELLLILANTASTVLQKARLHSEAEHARQQSRDLLERAQREERFKDAILRNIQSGLLTVDTEGRVTSLNRQGEGLFGIPEPDALGRPVEEVMVQVDPGAHVVRQALGARTSSRRNEVRVRSARGFDLTLAVTLAPLRQADGKELGALCAFQDLTPMRALEDDLRRLDNVSTMSEEASKIAHDMRSMITGVFMGMQKLAPMIADNDEARTDVNYMFQELSRLTALAENIREITKPIQLKPEPFDLMQVIERMLGVLAPRATVSHITIERHLEPGVMLMADQNMVHRAIENLCNNAIEAMPQGGKLTVTTRTTRASFEQPEATDGNTEELWSADPKAIVPVRRPTPSGPVRGFIGGGETELLLPDGRQRAVEIEISDTGKGIPPELRQVIWEPFKSFGKGNRGTGLGLAIVKQIIEAHSGTIALQSEVGRGTTFTLRLPLAR